MYPSINLSENVSVPTYYLVISLAVSISLLWITSRAQKGGFDQRLVLDLSLILMAAGFVGGRLFHIVYEEPAYYLENPLQMFAFWNGGFVFYGGVLLAAPCALIYALKKDRKNILLYLDLFAPVIAITYAIGRGACLLAGCYYGKYCELPWAVSGRHPTQAYAALWEVGVVFILLGLEKQKKRPGFIFYLWMILHGVGRLMMEAFRDDFRGATWGLSISSWISIVIIAAAGFLILRQWDSK